MKLEFASLEIEDIWEAQVDLVAYAVFPQQQSYHVPRRNKKACSTYTIISTNETYLRRNEKMQSTVAKRKNNDVEQDMAHCNNIGLTMLHVDMFKQ
jgi:hypothetical protein